MQVFQPHYSKVYQLISDPLSVARELYNEGVFRKDILDKIRPGSRLHSSQKDLFFSKLREMIRNDDKNLKVFATVLCLYGNTVTVGKALLDDYSELTVPLTQRRSEGVARCG